MKLVIAATGASGTIYLQRLLEQIDCAAHEVHLVMSAYAREVAKQELDAFKIPTEVSPHSESDMKRLVGLLTPENVTELMMVQSAMPQRRAP